MKTLQLSRRTLLKGLGAALALPFLEAMMPGLATAAPAKALPRRMAFLYVPNGINMGEWRPSSTGALELKPTLEPLAALKDDIMVISGLTCDKARPNGDGAGDHARAMAAFLTGAQPRKTAGADIRAGVSVDQVAAMKVGKATRFASLEIGCEGGRLAGNCDSGYSCAYSSNLSWRGEATPMAKEINPRLVFERLFSTQIGGDASDSKARRDRYNQSILDFVAEDARMLKNRLGMTDQRKLDEYLVSVRELEVRIARSEKPETGPGNFAKPIGVPDDYQEHLRLMADLLVLAFQTDQTRIATFVFANEGSNRKYSFLGIPEGHHDLSHHQNDKKKLEKLGKINRFHIEQVGYLLGKLKAVKEGTGTLLDQCMIVYGSGNSDGNRHNHDDLPILVAGKGGGSIKPGRHVQYRRETPLTNLYLGLLDRMEAPTEKLGDSTGKLEGLDG
jgi:hypothetical protein